jgi:PAS domain S-box-containing protein
MPSKDEARSATANLPQRLDFETLVSQLSSSFINQHPGEIDREIEVALRRLCEPLGIDLAVLWQWSDLTPGVATATHVYTREGVPPPGPMRQEQFPWCAQELLAGRVVTLPSLEALPAQAAVDLTNGRLMCIRSNLSLPLTMGGDRSMGILSLNTLQAQRDWPDSLVKRLQLVAQVFTNALVRERHERSLRESEARLAAGADLAGLAYYEVDFSLGIVQVDERFRELTGVPADRTQGMQALEFWIEHLHAEDRERVLDLRRQLHDGSLELLSIEYRFLHPTRGERWIHHLGRVVTRDATRHTIQSFGVLREITQSKRAEDALRDLSRRLIRAHEDERALLARELHDDVTQRLAVLAIEVGRAELATSAAAQPDTLRVVREGLVRLSEDIHSLAYQLHPSVLEELGLLEALRAEGERWGRQGRLDVSMDLEALPAGFGKEVDLCLFRVVQEALNNVARHAATRAARITLRAMDGGVLLAVHDGGVGFDAQRLPERTHLGLASMRERVKLVNGTLDIESAPGHGTTLVAWVPAQGGEGHSR